MSQLTKISYYTFIYTYLHVIYTINCGSLEPKNIFRILCFCVCYSCTNAHISTNYIVFQFQITLLLFFFFEKFLLFFFFYLKFLAQKMSFYCYFCTLCVLIVWIGIAKIKCIHYGFRRIFINIRLSFWENLNRLLILRTSFGF